MSDVFISYKRENLAAVNRLVEALRAEGVGVWWDQDIAPNAPWEATIERELAAARLVIVAWSPASVASDNVKAEARWARGQGRLLQVFVEACEPPLFFGERQGVDLKGWSGGVTDPAFRTLLQAVRAEPTPTSEKAASEAPRVPLPLPSKPSIAVLPFANLSGDPEQEYFADGMVDEITNALSRFKSLFVIASSSALTFKGKSVGAQDAAKQLGVRYVLEGNVRKAGNRVRISVKLIDAADGAHVWSERFDDGLEDVFDLQDKVALAVAGKIEPTIQQADIRRAVARPTDNLGSYELYLRSLPLSRTQSRADTLAALELVDRAIALDPQFGAALSMAAFYHVLIVVYGWSDDPETHRRRGIELARRAQKAQGDDAEILARVAGVVSGLERDSAAAIGLIERALALNPGSSNVWLTSGILRLRAGDLDAAVEHLETSMRLDPLAPFRSFQLGNLGQARFHQGRYAEAVAPLKEATQQSDAPHYFAYLAATYGYLGETGAAREALERCRALSAQPIAAMVGGVTRDPAQLKQLLDGIALAEGKSPAEGAGDA